MGISTHILDTSRGRPAAGVAVTLEHRDGDAWSVVGRGTTDADGRLRTLVPDGAPLATGAWRLRFEVAPYFTEQDTRTFFPTVEITFHVASAGEHYHVPLLLSPFGYSTYRGS